MHTYFYDSYKELIVSKKEKQEENLYIQLISDFCLSPSSKKNIMKIAQDQIDKMNPAKVYVPCYKCMTSNLNIKKLNTVTTLFADIPLSKSSPLKNKCAVHSTRPEYCGKRLPGWNRNLGSATIEAVCVIPLLLFAFLGFYMICQIYIMDDQIYQAGRNTADYLAEYAYIAECEADGKEELLADVLGLGLANAKLQSELQHNTRVERYVKDGRSGVYAWSLNLLDQEGYISFEIHYQVRLQVPLFRALTMRIRIPIRQKAYVGYIPDGKKTDQDNTYVYVTEHGTVYHNTRSCSHLKVTIHSISANVLQYEYKKLPPCEYCGKIKVNTYYLSEYGECYHSSATCSRLQRSIHRVRLRDVEGLGACSSCGSN